MTTIVPPVHAYGADTVQQTLARLAPPPTPEEVEAERAAYERMMAYSRAAVIGDPRAPIDPPNTTTPYDYGDPRANRDPLNGDPAMGALASPLAGLPNLWIIEREHLFASVPISAAPFVVGMVPTGLNYALSEQDVAALEAHYFGVQK